MAASRTPGPLGVSGEPRNLNDGTMARTIFPSPGPIGRLTDADQDLMLDLAQMALDLAGIVDPTPVSDGASMAISLGRGDYSGAAISGVSMIPFIGDLAKSAKLGRYLATLGRAADAAASNPVFRRQFPPIAKQLAAALEDVRIILPTSAQAQIDAALSKLEKALGGRRLLPLRSAPQLEKMALQLLELSLKGRKDGKPIALYFGIGFPPPVPNGYMTVERLVESVPGGKNFLAFIDPKSGNVSYRDVEQMWQMLSERVAEAASAQGRVDVFVSPQWFKRMFPSAAVPASVADKEFVAGAASKYSGRYLDEAFNKIESLSLRDVQFIAVTPGGKEVARQKHRL
jgi:hypothetical protein